MKIMFRISKMGFGGAEQVFISLAKSLMTNYRCEIHFVVDNLLGKNTNEPERFGCKLINLNVRRNMLSILPLIKVINTIKPDVIISAYTDTNAACILSNMLSCHKVPVIVSEHASLFEHWSDKSWAKKKLLEFYVSKLYKLSSLVVCVSNGLTEQVSNLIRSDERVITIYNPLRYSEFSYGKYDAENRVKPITLLAVGRVSVPKDFKTLLRAVKIVSLSYDIELKIVGGIFCQEEYRRLVVLLQDLRMEKIVKFEGYHSDVSNFYKTSDILVMSSAWEGFGNVIIESMSFGLPIVSTDCNFGPREILNGGKLGRLVPVGDHEELAKAIISEINQPLVSKEEIINRAKDFSETKIVDKYYKAIEYVCKNK